MPSTLFRCPIHVVHGVLVDGQHLKGQLLKFQRDSSLLKKTGIFPPPTLTTREIERERERGKRERETETEFQIERIQVCPE